MAPGTLGRHNLYRPDRFDRRKVVERFWGRKLYQALSRTGFSDPWPEASILIWTTTPKPRSTLDCTPRGTTTAHGSPTPCVDCKLSQAPGSIDFKATGGNSGIRQPRTLLAISMPTRLQPTLASESGHGTNLLLKFQCQYCEICNLKRSLNQVPANWVCKPPTEVVNDKLRQSTPDG